MISLAEPHIPGRLLLKLWIFAALALTVALVLAPVAAYASSAGTLGHKTASVASAPLMTMTAGAKGDPAFPRLADDISSSGLFQHHFAEGLKAYQRGDYDDADLNWQLLARQGHTISQFFLGVMYNNGIGVKRDLSEALRWYRLAAEQGHTDAQYNLGVAYAKGIGIGADIGQAVGWWYKAAMQGSTDAQYNLALLYARGQGVTKDLVKAAMWWRRAAILGDAASQYILGLMYAKGDGVAQNIGEAIKWWHKSATQGFERARQALDIIGNTEQPENKNASTRR